MPTLKPPSSEFQIVKLPDVLQHYIDTRIPKGLRNPTLFQACLQARDIHWSQVETESRLVPLAAERDGLSELEARRTIRSAYSKDARDLPYGFHGDVPYRDVPRRTNPVKDKPTPVLKVELDPEFKLPEEIPNGAVELLKILFEPGEWIMIASAEYDHDDKKETVSGLQVTWERDALIKQIELYGGKVNRLFEDDWNDGVDRGVFFCINPLKSEHCRRLSENVSVFRSILLEFDEKEVGKDAEGEPIMERIPLEVQLQSFIQSKAPIRAIEFSGNKSLHAYPKSGSRDETEHKQRAAAYMEFFGGRKMGIDESTKDPVRFSRLPDCYRSDVAGKSKLIALGMGAESYEAWMSEVAVLGSQLPELMKIDDLIAFVAEDDPDRLIGENRFLGKGTSFLISGHSGIGKSSLSLQKAICFSVEKPFLPRPDGTGGLEASRPVKTLIVQSENDLGDMAEAMQGIVTGLELTPDEIKLMKENIQIRHDTAHTGLEFIDMLYHLFAQFKADVILIDPLFAFVGADITKAEVIGDFFRKGLNTFMQVTKCIVIFMHHIPKPSTDPRHTRQGHDDIYSGAGSAELTNWARATATLKPMNGYFQLIFGKRSKRTGILNDEGKPTNCLELQHGKDGIFWERLDTGLKDEMDKKAEEARKKPVGRPKKTITFSEGATAAIQKFVTERDPSQEGLKEELKRLFSKESPGFVMEKILEAGIILKSEIPDAKNGERKFKFVVPE